ncbi:MAG: PEGA domain-containing protein [Candidatus Shapirobacteria bacterium]
MNNSSTKKSIFIIFFVLLFITGSTYMISIYARGYKLNIKEGISLKSTGILSATSKPKGASVYINDRLLTATDDTINLSPDEYTIKIAKDGYLPWQKTVQIKKEIVYQTDTQLYRSSPDLKPITLTGAINPTSNKDLTKIVYSVASASASKDNGLYLIELTGNAIIINRNIPRQISQNFPNVDWSKFSFVFSPDSRQILATNKTNNTSYLLPTDTPITQKNLLDVTLRLSLIKEDWNNQSGQLIASKLDLLPKELRDLVSTDSAKYTTFSSSEDKVLYLAKNDSKVPENITTPAPAKSTQAQSRDIKKGNYYVYDIKDDTNFLIGSSDKISNPFWLPNSSSVIFVNDQKIKVVEYDATNEQTLFAGNFNKDSVYPWADGNKIVTLTSLYSGSPENLYAIVIR